LFAAFRQRKKALGQCKSLLDQVEFKPVIGQLKKAHVSGSLPKLISDLFSTAIKVGQIDNGYVPFDLPTHTTKGRFQVQFFQRVFFCSVSHCASRHIAND